MDTFCCECGWFGKDPVMKVIGNANVQCPECNNVINTKIIEVTCPLCGEVVSIQF